MTTESLAIPRVSYPFNVRSTRPLELAVACVVILATITGIVLSFYQTDVLGALLPPVTAAVGFAIAWRWPYLGVLLVVAAPFVAALSGESGIVTWSVVAMSTFVITLRGAKSRFIAPLAAVCAYAGEAMIETDGFASNGAFVALAVTFAAAASGSAIREHFKFLGSVEQRAAEALRTRDAQRHRRVTEERLHIARDLHDVVGHQVAVVNMQIGMAEVALPQEATASLAALHDARVGVKTILQESQRILAVLRDTEESDEFAPAPTLSRLGELIASFRAIGLDIDSHIVLPPDGTVDPGVEATAYRVVQEALTNAHRHGGGATVVRVASRGSALTIDVSNPIGESSESEGSGYGLLGMRERVQSVGGELQLSSNGVFTVSVSLPAKGSTRA